MQQGTNPQRDALAQLMMAQQAQQRMPQQAGMGKPLLPSFAQPSQPPTGGL
jgi:hypothetical protein